MAFIAGPFSATFDGSAIGITQDGFELECTGAGDPITGDNLGAIIQDYVMRGGNVYINTVIEEWDATLGLILFWPYFAAFGRWDQVGKLASGLAKALVLTRVSAATTATPASLTANKAIIPPDFPTKHLFATRLRSVPLRLQLLPYVSTYNLAFTVT